VTLLPHPDPETAALLFDCDGTLVDTMGVHRIVWTEIFGRYGFEITDQWWEDYANVALIPFVRAVIPDASEEFADELNAEGMARYMEAIHLAEPLEHVIEVARAHHGRLPMAVVTGGYREIIVPTRWEADDRLPARLSLDGLTESSYESTAHYAMLYSALLQVDPARCMAYEDSEIGMASAHGAGIGRIIDIRLAWNAAESS